MARELQKGLRAVRIEPAIMQRTGTDISAGHSVPADHLLWLIFDCKWTDGERVRIDRLIAPVRECGHDWSDAEFRGYLEELRRNQCIRFVR